MTKIINGHNSIFYLFSEECLLKEVVEFDLIEFTNDEYVYDIIGCLISEVEYRIRDGNEIEGFSSFEEFSYGLHHVIALHKHLNELWIYQGIMIHLIVFFLVLFV